MQIKLIIISFLAVALIACSHSQLPKVQTQINTQHGIVQGYSEQGINIFKGIPYAKPPVGSLRWQAPQSLASWSGIKQTTKFASDCMQLPFAQDAAPLTTKPSEDCLYLNVWAPQRVTAEQKYPVAVWIHGGGYVNGGSSPEVYHGDSFAQNDVVFVSFNYRLGRFGFFAHPALKQTEQLANFAFSDQLAALAWVQNNIAAFGGDPDNVTLIGESAGGDSVLTLMRHRKAEDLFSKAVVMSGGDGQLMGMSSRAQAEQAGLNFAKQNGIKQGENSLAELIALPAEKIVADLNLATLSSVNQNGLSYSGPVQDGVMLKGTFTEQGQADEVHVVPLMVGTTNQDLGRGNYANKTALFASFGQFSELAKNIYDQHGKTPLADLIYQVGQDRLMQAPARQLAKFISQAEQPAYLYRFSYVASQLEPAKGALHASEIPYFFNTAAVNYQLSQRDQSAMFIAHRYLLNFIKNGDPNEPNLAKWAQFELSKSNMQIITPEGQAIHRIDPRRAQLNLIERIK
ncbi:carboxylesterase/lipase family protein [Gayadomonas joobiniege]|uniref:carboxylesterase/lipase family protein n=1 Tax=Gayadomonas joobiniege TaxID=1234606 RepID=UPI0012DCCF6E|nr:carboxylesterase family protein [Gayadomonas joobiniege]